MAGAFVQGAATAAQDDSGSYTTDAVAFGSNCTSGNLITIECGCGSTATPTASDSQSNTYTLQTNTYDATNNQSHFQFYAKNITGGANTVTVNWGALKSYNRLIIGEHSGLDTTAPLDQAAAQAQAGGTSTDYYSSGNITTSNTCYCVAGLQNIDEAGSSTDTVTAGATPAYTKRTDEAGILTTETAASLASGTFDANFTRNVSRRCITGVMAFKESAGGGGPTISVYASLTGAGQR